MRLKIDKNLYEQIGLDSGSLTMLGTVVHSLGEPGEYRGVVYGAEGREAVFYLSADPNSPVAHVRIDLASLAGSPGAKAECCDEKGERHFTVNPRGYVVFYVSGGSEGYSVQVRRATDDPEERIFNSQELGEGDIFSAMIIRPGTYSVVNLLTRAEAKVVVGYPEIGKTAVRPSGPVRVQFDAERFEPGRIELKPAQGLVFDIKTPSRIAIRLVKADYGPPRERKAPPRGWTKKTAPKIVTGERSPSQRKTTLARSKQD